MLPSTFVTHSSLLRGLLQTTVCQAFDVPRTSHITTAPCRTVRAAQASSRDGDALASADAVPNHFRVKAVTAKVRKKYNLAAASKRPPKNQKQPNLEAAPAVTSRAKKASKSTEPEVQQLTGPLKQGAQQQATEADGITDRQLLQYVRDGHLVTRALLNTEKVLQLKETVHTRLQARELEALRHRIRVLCPSRDPASVHSKREALRELQQHGVEPVGFLQLFNLHREDETVKQLLTAGLLPRTAAKLLGTNKLRLYQDCCFVKNPGFAWTNWHSDLRMAVLDTNDYVTAWIPLRPIQEDHDSGLIFASRSHNDFALAFWRDAAELEDLDLSSRNYNVSHTGKMALGDVSWHHGWTVHCAPAQPKGSSPRLALSVSYFRDGAKLLPKRHAHKMQTEDQESYQDWLPDIKDGAAARHPLLPLICV